MKTIFLEDCEREHQPFYFYLCVSNAAKYPRGGCGYGCWMFVHRQGPMSATRVRKAPSTLGRWVVASDNGCCLPEAHRGSYSHSYIWDKDRSLVRVMGCVCDGTVGPKVQGRRCVRFSPA